MSSLPEDKICIIYLVLTFNHKLTITVNLCVVWKKNWYWSCTMKTALICYIFSKSSGFQLSYCRYNYGVTLIEHTDRTGPLRPWKETPFLAWSIPEKFHSGLLKIKGLKCRPSPPQPLLLRLVRGRQSKTFMVFGSASYVTTAASTW